MCGVVGWLGPPSADARTLVQTVEGMAATLVHRGPDDEGRWVDASAGVAFAFRRLAVLDVSQTGHQPMSSADGRYVCVFNGEIYNHRDLRAELERRGARFRGTSDTEVIAEATSAFGPEGAVSRLWGMFALGIWSRADRTLLLARDRLGKKPLYVTDIGGAGWLFASELKAFHAMGRFRREVDPVALFTYLRFGYVPGPRTIFCGAWKLEPGTFTRFRFGQAVHTERFWNPCDPARDPARARRRKPVETLASELDRLLRDAVSRRMIADVPVGAFLSGGVDSSAVVALMQAQSRRAVPTFTVGFRCRGYDEAADAAAVARHLGTAHSTLYVSTDDAIETIPELPQIYDEPFGDASQVPMLLISRLARRYVTVALSGDGGDEIFGGYDHYRRVRALWAAASCLPRDLRPPVGALLTRVPVPWWDRIYRWVAPTLPARLRQRRFGERMHRAGGLLCAADSPDALYWRMVAVWPDEEALSAVPETQGEPWESARLGAEIRDFRDRMTLYDQMTYLPDDILVKVDRAAMAASLEVRSPLLDHRIVEWALGLPPSMRCRWSPTKWILRRVLHRYVPRRLVDRPKAGFAIPLDHWLRGSLRDWAEHLLRSDRIEAAGLRPGPVRKAWRRHLAGMAEHHRLWVVLMWIAWRERWA